MAKQTPDRPRDTGAQTPSSPSPRDRDGTRDEIVQEHPQRRRDEPAAAPMTTDAETGDPRAPQGPPPAANPTPGASDDRRDEGPVPRKEPAKTHVVTTGESTRDPEPRRSRDVRAGPGDAGGARSPDATPEPAKSPRDRGGQTLMWIGIGIAVLILLFWLF